MPGRHAGLAEGNGLGYRLTAAGRLTVLVTLVVAMVAALTVTNIGAADADTSAQTERQALIDSLAASDDDHVATAVEHLTKSLDPKLWADDDTPTAKGEKIFQLDAKAAKELAKADDPAAAAGLAQLLAMDQELATAAIAAAEAAGAEADKVDKARREYDKAAAKAAEGKPKDACEKLGRAWKEATKAEAKAIEGAEGEGSEGGKDGGKYAAYTFRFWNRHTGEVVEVSATNAYGTPGHTGQGNEGYLWIGAERLQLHVSCSDAFPDGVGAKSDPQPESAWRVIEAHIAKVKDGQVEKVCDITGLIDPPVVDPPTDPGDPPS